MATMDLMAWSTTEYLSHLVIIQIARKFLCVVLFIKFVMNKKV